MSELIQLAIYGENSTWPIAKELIRKGPLNVRMEVIGPWLVWLKKIGNPEFKNVRIPTEEEIEKEQLMLDESMQKILDNAIKSESRQINNLAQDTRANVEDNLDGLNEKMDGGSIFRNVLLFNESDLEEPMHNILNNIKQKMETTKQPNEISRESSKIKITIKDSLYNEYEDNHRLISAAFPYIFPFGLTENNCFVTPVNSLLNFFYGMHSHANCR